MNSASAEPLFAVTEHQPQVRLALTAALRTGASHAYLLHGPTGSGKRDVARAFAAELLVEGVAAGDPPSIEDTRRRALLDPSPHPDLIWIAPEGMQHRVEEIRDRVIRMASRRPFEGGRRVFVIEQAEAMRDEAQNALLKTLEEPPAFVHLLLISQAIEEVLPTVRSRCQLIEFAPLPPDVVEGRLATAEPGLGGDRLRAAARLAEGDVGRARSLLSEQGQALRAAVELFIASALDDDDDAGDNVEPWRAILGAAERAGEAAEESARDRIDSNSELGLKLSKTESNQAVRREARRARTEVLDLALDLMLHWLRDLSVIDAGAEELVHNSDRRGVLAEHAARTAAGGLRDGLASVGDYRRRLLLNVSEELAFEALHSELRRDLRKSR